MTGVATAWRRCASRLEALDATLGFWSQPLAERVHPSRIPALGPLERVSGLRATRRLDASVPAAARPWSVIDLDVPGVLPALLTADTARFERRLRLGGLHLHAPAMRRTIARSLRARLRAALGGSWYALAIDPRWPVAASADRVRVSGTRDGDLRVETLLARGADALVDSGIRFLFAIVGAFGECWLRCARLRLPDCMDDRTVVPLPRADAVRLAATWMHVLEPLGARI